MTKITFHGGVNEIGGNKILVEDGDSKIFLDFGKNFGQEGIYFNSPYIVAREESDLLEFGILPNIKGLYKKDGNECGVDAIFLSHAHMDHYDAIRFIKDCCPIHCGETAMNIILGREFSGTSIGEDYVVAKMTVKDGVTINKKFAPFRTGSVVTDFSPLEITPIHVDHSIPGSYGFLVESSNANIVYSGDFRMHGVKSDMTNDFIKKAKEFEPDIMIIEGTHIDYSSLESEGDVKQKIERLVAGTKGIVLCGCSNTDIDRLRTLYEVAISQGRKLAISMKQASIIHQLRKDSGLSLFSLSDPGVRIYQKDKKTMRLYEKIIVGAYGNNVIDAGLVGKNNGEFMMVATLYDMGEMIDIKPMPGSIYILASAEAFNEEMEMQQDRLLSWLNHYGIPVYHIHASGHASALELKNAIEEIRPKKVFPVHTQYPELFKKFMGNIGIDIELPRVAAPVVI
jgi:ribonuclease J